MPASTRATTSYSATKAPATKTNDTTKSLTSPPTRGRTAAALKTTSHRTTSRPKPARTAHSTPPSTSSTAQHLSLRKAKSAAVPKSLPTPLGKTTANNVAPPSPRAQRYDKRKRLADDVQQDRAVKRHRPSRLLSGAAAPCGSSTPCITLAMDVDNLTNVASSSKTTLEDIAMADGEDKCFDAPNVLLDSASEHIELSSRTRAVEDDSVPPTETQRYSPPSDSDSDSSDEMLAETPDADGVFVMHTAPGLPCTSLPSYPNITPESFVPERPTRLSPLSCMSFTAEYIEDTHDIDADGELDEEFDHSIFMQPEYSVLPERRQHKVDPDLWKFIMRQRVARVVAEYGTDLIRELVEEEAAQHGDYRDEEPYDFELEDEEDDSDEWEPSSESSRLPDVVVFSATSESTLESQSNSTQPRHTLRWPPPKLGSVLVADMYGFSEGWKARGTPIDHGRRAAWASPPPSPLFHTASPSQLYNTPPSNFHAFSSPSASQHFPAHFMPASSPSPTAYAPEFDTAYWELITFSGAAPVVSNPVASLVASDSSIYSIGTPVESFTDLLYAGDGTF